ncbi:hypothetical protein [Streptomyces sp. NPDC003327]
MESTRAAAISEGGDAPDAEVVAFVAQVVRVFLSSSGEGAHLVDRNARGAAEAYGHRASLVVVPDGAVVTVGAGAGAATTVTVRAVPEVFRLDQMVALKPRSRFSPGTSRTADRCC